MNPIYPKIENDDDLSRAIAGIRAGEEIGKALIRVADAAATTMMTDPNLAEALRRFIVSMTAAIADFHQIVKARNAEIETYLGEKPAELLGKKPESNVVPFAPREKLN